MVNQWKCQIFISQSFRTINTNIDRVCLHSISFRPTLSKSDTALWYRSQTILFFRDGFVTRQYPSFRVRKITTITEENKCNNFAIFSFVTKLTEHKSLEVTMTKSHILDWLRSFAISFVTRITVHKSFMTTMTLSQLLVEPGQLKPCLTCWTCWEFCPLSLMFSRLCPPGSYPLSKPEHN